MPFAPTLSARDQSDERQSMHITRALRDRGYARIPVSDLAIDFDHASALAEIRREFDGLERDPYGDQDNRHRRYARGVLLPWSEHFEWIPAARGPGGAEITEYYQGAYNPLFSDLPRALPAISQAARRNPLIRHLIKRDYARIFLEDRQRIGPLNVGLSFIKTAVPGGGGKALSTPDTLHQDGELFTFAHLINRQNAEGGVNTIATPGMAGRHPDQVAAADILASFELQAPLESYAIFDPLISHHVSAVTARDPDSAAERCIMLIDFTPMVPVHHQRPG